jgi:outer membrane receptor protein involved in Fe transport
LLLWALSSPGAELPSTAFRFDIPATTLDEALARFSEQTGLSVGMPGNMPRPNTRGLSGRLTPQAALERLLAGTGLRAIRIGDGSFLLELAAPGASDPNLAPVASDSFALQEVVVTAAKREQDWRTVPIPMTVISEEDLALGPMPGGSRSALQLDAATSSTNLGPGRERQFIRGVADSPFLGPSQATVSVQFDDARATYDAPDPDLILLDVARVEILKGPQGPLYGTGALGGVYHIVPRRPDLERFSLTSGLQMQQVASGATSAGGDLVLNLPLVANRLAVRGVVYATTDPGWIDNIGARSNANDTQIRGARLALRSELSNDWTLQLQGVGQSSKTADSQYVNDSAHQVQRAGITPEPRDNDFYLGMATAQGRLWGMNSLLTASFVRDSSDGTLDASGSASEWGVAAPVSYSDTRSYRLFNQEVRFWSDKSTRVSWLGGLSYMSARSDLLGALEAATMPSREVLRLAQRVGEAAAFGEASIPLYTSFRATAGLRVFRSQIENEAHANTLEDEGDFTLYSATPSLSLDWRSTDERRFAYLRFARAVRPGGLNLDAAQLRRFDADELSNLDLGMRWLLDEDALSIDSALFVTDWTHIQSDYLLTNGLVGTRNVGSGRVIGLETSGKWKLDDNWRLEAGFTVQHARLHTAAVADEDDERLPVVPDLRARAAIAREFSLGSWSLQVRADLRYTGSSRLSFEPALDRKTDGYVLADIGARLQRGAQTWSLQVRNLFDSEADTFAYGNPFSIRTRSQFTPLVPRSITLGLSYSFDR